MGVHYNAGHLGVLNQALWEAKETVKEDVNIREGERVGKERRLNKDTTDSPSHYMGAHKA